MRGSVNFALLLSPLLSWDEIVQLRRFHFARFDIRPACSIVFFSFGDEMERQ